MIRKSRVIVAALCALAVSASASANRSATPGVTSKQILLGGTTPTSGGTSAYAEGADAYFRYVNDHGGVYGRQVKYKYVDDGSDPAQTLQRTKDLVQNDKVFAIFNSLGTAENLAVRDYLKQLKIPQLFVASGASTFGRDYRKYPWTIGYQPSYLSEGILYGRYVAKNRPTARVGVLYENDEYGKELLTGLVRGLGKKAKLIVSTQPYDPAASDVKAQIARLKAKRVNALMLFATPKFAIQSYVAARALAWRPLVFVDADSSAANIMLLAKIASSKGQVDGSLTISFLKDPSDPRWANDPAIRLYKSVMKKYQPKNDPKDLDNVYGMAAAYTMVDTLRKAGKNLTRAAVMNAALHLNEKNPFLLPGITVRTTPTNRFPVGQARLTRYHGGRWSVFGPIIGVR